MFQTIVFIIFITSLSYLWNYFSQPTVYLTIQQCRNPPSPSNSLRTFLIQQYEKLINQNLPKPPTCRQYKINLHLSLTFFILNSLCLISFIKLIVYLYKQLCYYILRKQTYPFVHIRSIALTNTTIDYYNKRSAIFIT